MHLTLRFLKTIASDRNLQRQNPNNKPNNTFKAASNFSWCSDLPK